MPTVPRLNQARRIADESLSVREVAFDRVQDTPLFVDLHPQELSQRLLIRPDDPLCGHGANVYLEITETAASPTSTYM